MWIIFTSMYLNYWGILESLFGLGSSWLISMWWCNYCLWKVQLFACGSTEMSLYIYPVLCWFTLWIFPIGIFYLKSFSHSLFLPVMIIKLFYMLLYVIYSYYVCLKFIQLFLFHSFMFIIFVRRFKWVFIYVFFITLIIFVLFVCHINVFFLQTC